MAAEHPAKSHMKPAGPPTKNTEPGNKHFEAHMVSNVNALDQALCMDEREIALTSQTTPLPEIHGPNFPGGSLIFDTIFVMQHPAWHLGNGTVTTIQDAMRDAGITPGVHRGHHTVTDFSYYAEKYITHTSPQHASAGHIIQEQGKSGCGYADQLIPIVQRAVSDRASITETLTSRIYPHLQQFLKRPEIGIHSQQEFEAVLAAAYNQMAAYHTSQIELTGEALVASSQTRGAEVSHVVGEHTAMARYINTRDNTTFDTHSAVLAGEPAFNFDLWAFVAQTRALNQHLTHEKLDIKNAVVQALILYEATARVLLPPTHAAIATTVHN